MNLCLKSFKWAFFHWTSSSFSRENLETFQFISMEILEIFLQFTEQNKFNILQNKEFLLKRKSIVARNIFQIFIMHCWRKIRFSLKSFSTMRILRRKKFFSVELWANFRHSFQKLFVFLSLNRIVYCIIMDWKIRNELIFVLEEK